MMMQQAKQNQMQRDPSGMDGNRDRPTSPASGDNAPSPSKRQRVDGGAPFNPNQPGAMMANGRPVQGMPGQQMPANSVAAAQQLLTANGINPNSLTPQQFQHFVNAPPPAQQKSIATYSQNLQQQQGNQMGNKQMPNAGPQNQGSPMMPQGPDGSALNAFYNPGDMAGPGMRAGPGGAQAAAAGSNHALQDYQMQLMLLEQQNKKRLMMARQEQDTITGMPREGGAPGQPGQGPNGQPFPDASPQGMRTGTSPNPSDQMKRGSGQVNNSGMPSPVPEGGQSRDSPNPAMNFMGNQVDPNMAPHFFKPGVEGNMNAAQAQMNGMRAPSSHPGQPFNGQMNPQQMMAARQMQQQAQGPPGQQQGGPGTPQQWQQGPNGQGNAQQVQGTPQQRSMPPPSAPAAGKATASPQQAAAAPPTPSQTTKAAPKKKETKAAKEKVRDPARIPGNLMLTSVARRCCQEGQPERQQCGRHASQRQRRRRRRQPCDASDTGLQQKRAKRSRSDDHHCCARRYGGSCASDRPFTGPGLWHDGQLWHGKSKERFLDST